MTDLDTFMNSLRYSPGTGAFYDIDLWPHPLPGDAVQISAEEHADLLMAAAQGMVISASANGSPVAAAPADPSEETLAKRARANRAKLLADVRPLIERHRDQIDLGVATTLSAETYVALLTYVQALRDAPTQSGFPAATIWPALPVGINITQEPV